MTPRVGTPFSPKIKQYFTPAELAEVEREVERKRDLRLALTTSVGERATAGSEYKQLVVDLPSSSDAVPVVSRDTRRRGSTQPRRRR